MLGKVKDYAVKKLLERQLKDVPEDQKEMIMTMVEKDPQLFEKIAKEIQAEMKANGNDQMQAAMTVLPRYQSEIMASMSPEMKLKLMNEQSKMQQQMRR